MRRMVLVVLNDSVDVVQGWLSLRVTVLRIGRLKRSGLILFVPLFLLLLVDLSGQMFLSTCPHQGTKGMMGLTSIVLSLSGVSETFIVAPERMSSSKSSRREESSCGKVG